LSELALGKLRTKIPALREALVGWAESRISDGRLQAAWACWVVSCEYRCCGVW
jgi:hypothetical protein